MTHAANAPLECDVCASCGALFDDQGGNGWWLAAGAWRHECAPAKPARIVVRRLPQTAWLRETAAATS